MVLVTVKIDSSHNQHYHQLYYYYCLVHCLFLPNRIIYEIIKTEVHSWSFSQYVFFEWQNKYSVYSFTLYALYLCVHCTCMLIRGGTPPTKVTEFFVIVATIMATSSSSTDDKLKCGICLELFQDPRSLPCLHTFCCECIQQSLLNDNRSLNCPVCRVKHELGEEGASLLPVDQHSLENYPFKSYCNSNALEEMLTRNVDFAAKPCLLWAGVATVEC